MSRTPTLPPTDKAMWRRLIARTHPDAGGDHELFIWVGSVRELVCSGNLRSRPKPEPPPEPRTVYEEGRVPFPVGVAFDELTSLALEQAGAGGDLYGSLLMLLQDCHSLTHLAHEEQRGASYRRLAYIGHLTGMTGTERSGWYRVAESIPLADRHAGHILKRLKEAA